MATPSKTTVCLVLFLAFVISVSAGDLDWVKTGRRLADNPELEFGGIPRRALDQTGYIGYDVLNPDNIPCDQRGQSYYSNCQPGAPVNPYNRDCNAISNCRTDN